MFRFTTVPLADTGVFGPGEVFRPRSGLTVVEASGGVGDVIAKACRAIHAQGHADPAPPWMVFLDSSEAPPYGGNPWPPLAPLVARLTEAGVPVQVLEREAEQDLRRLLRDKVGQPFTKFAAYLDHVEQVKLVFREGRIHLIATHLDADMSDDFHAMGERVVLSLALNGAARRLLGIDEPLVVESWFDWLDGHLLPPCWECASRMAPQVIIIAHPRTLSHLEIDPHVRIRVDPATGTKSLAATQEAPPSDPSARQPR